MIEGFRHKGLKRLFEQGDTRGVKAEYVEKIELILGILNVSREVEDMHIPTFHLHPLTGDYKGFWSVTVRANWRIIFRFVDGRAFDVDLVDYH
jgi:proteic killer suppression protein